MSDKEKDIFSIETREEYLSLKDKININKWNDDLQNALIHALDNLKYEKALWLVEEGICLREEENYIEDMQNNCSVAVSCLLSSREHPKLQKMMIKKGLKITPASDFDDNSYYFLASYAGDVEVLDILLKAGHKTKANGMKMSSHSEIKTRNLINEIKEDIMLWDYIIKNDIGDINSRNIYGNTLLFDNENPEQIDFLLSNNISINAQNDDGRTALFGASFAKAKKLIQFGIDVNLKTKNGENALFFTDDIDTALLLLENGIETTGDVYFLDGVGKEWVTQDNPVDFMTAIKLSNKKIYNIVSSFIEKEKLNKELNNTEESTVRRRL